MNKKNNFLYLLLTLIFSSMLTVTQVKSQEDLRYRYKAEGVILGEKIIIPNEPPIINAQTIPDGSSGVEYSHQLVASDPDGNSLTWSLSNDAPSGLNINSSTGEISGTLPVSNGGNYDFDVTVSDGIAESTATISMTVFGCTTGPLGTVCTDNYFYAGMFGGQRMYSNSGHPFGTRTWADAYNYCTGARSLTTRQQLAVIISNFPEFFNATENSANWNFWTSSTTSNVQWKYFYRAFTQVFDTTSSTTSKFKSFCVRY